jgi:adenylate kinase
MPIYALTGTPATGKTSISKNLDKKVLHLSDLYMYSSDGKSSNGEWLVDLEKLNNIVQEKLAEDIIVEGHFAHLMDNIDKIIVLRCDPKKLRTRMEKRGYTEDKIKENLEAEAIGLIYSQACEEVKGTELYQHDTTHRNVDESSEILKGFFEGNVKLDETIDYSERIMDWY